MAIVVATRVARHDEIDARALLAWLAPEVAPDADPLDAAATLITGDTPLAHAAGRYLAVVRAEL